MLRILLFLGLVCLAGEARAEWWRAETSNFVIQAEMSETELRKLAIELETMDGVIRTLSGAKVKAGKRRSDILVFDDLATVRRLSGIGNFTGGITIAMPEGEMVLAAQGNKLEGWRDPRSAVFHEYAHSFMRRHLGTLYPGWFVEGFATYFQTAEIVPGGSVLLGAMPLEIVDALAGGLGFADVMTLAAERQGGPAPTKLYAEGWLLTHHYFSGGPRAAELKRYVAAAGAGNPVDKPELFFAGGVAALDTDMAAYLKTQPGAVTHAAPPAEFASVRIRPMRAGETALVELRLRDFARAEAALLRDSSRAADAHVRLIAAKPVLELHPDEPGLMLLIAQLAIESGDEVLAGGLADKLLAAEPANPALIALKADVLAVDARNHPPRAVGLIRTGREMLTRAALAEPDNPAVAAALYRNYSAEQGASAETRRHLNRAVELNPDDFRLRRTALDFALRARDGKYAISLLTPAANSPHDTPRKHAAIKAIAEIRKTLR